MIMKDKYLVLIFTGVLLIILVYLIILKDPYITLIGIIIGMIAVLIMTTAVLEKLFPKNSLSKILEKSVEWIQDNLKV